ncbi:MAG TPA: MaoC/PaaZ C-terminal domain-containing protein [Rhizomicrobium sp.]|jgi:3-hydroxybutyryl-CoA dehydratase
MTIKVGDAASHVFTLTPELMARFQEMSGDDSRIHTDDAFAKSRGYKGVIAYGGIMLAQLSRVVGTMLPGANGMSVKWAINYREPLYVGETAELRLEVAYASKDHGLVEGKFKITCDDRTIATGTTQSIVPKDEIAD